MTAYLEAQREKELGEIIVAENLKPEETAQFIDAAFREGSIRASGTAITKVLPPVSRFSKEKNHGEKKRRVVQQLGEFFERFFGLVSKR